jgi:hypothetical protein
MIQFSLINYLSGKTLGYGCHRTFDRSLIDEAERRTWFFWRHNTVGSSDALTMGTKPTSQAEQGCLERWAAKTSLPSATPAAHSVDRGGLDARSKRE